MRRGALGLVALSMLALSGCKKEPDFDARYQAAEKQIADTARDIEAQVDATAAPTPLAGATEE